MSQENIAKFIDCTVAVTKKYIKKVKEEERKENEKKFEQLKRDINIKVKFNSKLSPEIEEKIREYIDLCYILYQKKKMSKDEIIFLKQALQRVTVDDEDILKFAKRCCRIEKEYEQALELVKNRRQMRRKIGSESQEMALRKIEGFLEKVCSVQQAVQIIKSGNDITEVICETTGLTEDEVNILKMELAGKAKKLLLNVPMRDAMVNGLAQHENSIRVIQKDMGMSDLEIADMEEQARYRRIDEEKRDTQAQIKQDSTIRIVVLCTKLKRKPEQIARLLKKETKDIEKDLEKALEVGLIKENELKGINILDSKEILQQIITR